jgi:hypothetical protein
MRMTQLQRALAIIGFAAASSLAQASNFGSLVQMEVLPQSGYSFNTYQHGYQTWLAGDEGASFKVRLRNTSGERVLVVLSVDGVNAINGQTAGFHQPGYVLMPYQTLNVDGWRKSNRSVASFYFTHIADSYAARTDRPDNVGVIGGAVFREARAYGYDNRYPYEYERDRRYGGKSQEAPASSRQAPMAESAAESAAPEAKSYSDGVAGSAPLGTGHGEQRYSRVRNMQFERESQPAELLSIRYDSLQNLQAMGIAPTQYRYQQPYPQAFPREGGYVPDPPRYGWR